MCRKGEKGKDQLELPWNLSGQNDNHREECSLCRRLSKAHGLGSPPSSELSDQVSLYGNGGPIISFKLPGPRQFRALQVKASTLTETRNKLDASAVAVTLAQINHI